jgi:hypothetical protein
VGLPEYTGRRHLRRLKKTLTRNYHFDIFLPLNKEGSSKPVRFYDKSPSCRLKVFGFTALKRRRSFITNQYQELAEKYAAGDNGPPSGGLAVRKAQESSVAESA